MDKLQVTFDIKRKYFDDGNTRSYEFRIAALRKLKDVIKKNENQILEALYKDLHKPAFEGFTSEVGFMYEEINVAIKNLRKWMRVKKTSTPIAIAPSSSYVYSEPLGVVLIIGPWNYPFQLLLAPLVGAIAGGNCAIIKPSDQTKHTSDIVAKLIGETFEEEYISVVQGPGAMIGPQLIEQFRFDHIFFTGSPNVGKKIAAMAASGLTPITLELGGKSPVIVDKDVNAEVSARRLVWGKFFNAGQTCVCPDYLLIHEDIKDVFVKKMIENIRAFFGDNPMESESFGRIVNGKRFGILKSFLAEGNVLVGGESDEDSLYISPTLIDNLTMDSKIMQEEVFGPIFPILTYKTNEEAVAIIRKNRYPLSLYLYTNNKATEEYFIEKIEFGGGCINNSMVHLVNPNIPFGGVGFSGMGMYHGKYSFETFTHKKSIIKTKNFFDPLLRYAPYNVKKLNLAKKLFR